MGNPDTMAELRLFLEEICCDLCRYRHVEDEGLAAERVATTREVRLGGAGQFADIEVVAGDDAPYCVEIKWGYRADEFVERLARKYETNPMPRCRKLVAVTDLAQTENWPAISRALRARISTELEIEVWGEAEILRGLDRFFGIRVASLADASFQAIRDAIIRAQWRHAFGDDDNLMLASTLLWHFSPWRLRRIRDELKLRLTEILRPDIYRNVIIVMADLCSFSSYVRDTNDEAVVRQALTTFYSQARQTILDNGGMLDKFVGDEVMGIFGFPHPTADYAEDALNCAHRLNDIGHSVSEHWQAKLDRLQKSGGVHVGIAIGDLNLMPLRAFSQYHVGFIGDAINMTARLMSVAAPGEIVISNRLYDALKRASRREFEPLAPVEAKNMGLIKSWRWAGAT